jgi:hypothetical protein
VAGAKDVVKLADPFEVMFTVEVMLLGLRAKALLGDLSPLTQD